MRDGDRRQNLLNQEGNTPGYGGRFKRLIAPKCRQSSKYHEISPTGLNGFEHYKEDFRIPSKSKEISQDTLPNTNLAHPRKQNSFLRF